MTPTTPAQNTYTPTTGPTAPDRDRARPILEGLVLHPGATHPPAPAPPGGYGLGWWLTTPLRSAAWLAVAVCLAATLIPLIAVWSTASPRRTALTTALTALALAAHH